MKTISIAIGSLILVAGTICQGGIFNGFNMHDSPESSEQVTCPRCNGTGKDPTHADSKCLRCNGSGKIEKTS